MTYRDVSLFILCIDFLWPGMHKNPYFDSDLVLCCVILINSVIGYYSTRNKYINSLNNIATRRPHGPLQSRFSTTVSPIDKHVKSTHRVFSAVIVSTTSNATTIARALKGTCLKKMRDHKGTFRADTFSAVRRRGVCVLLHGVERNSPSRSPYGYAVPYRSIS
jgi:hypothetical protein